MSSLENNLEIPSSELDMPEGPVIQLNFGAIRGRIVENKDCPYYSFQGIRYAEPPVGELRYKAPVPIQPWTGIRDATACGPECPQYDPYENAYVGDDDSLCVNVYVPKSVADTPFDFLPVIVYVHGGGFLMKSGADIWHGPEYFMQNSSIILVTFNYRLGPLGLCNLETPEVPGNAAMMDQVQVLKWVRQNIGRFRGDCENVTLLGCSAGAASAHLLLLSPLTKGLIHRLIIQSGSAFNYWAASASCKPQTIRLAKALGYSGPEDDLKAISKVLLSASTEEIIKTYSNSYSPEESDEIFKYFLSPNWLSGYPVENAFLPAPPEELLVTSKTHKVPIIFGMTSLEAGGMFFDILNKKDIDQYLENNPKYFLPKDIKEILKNQPEKINALGQKVRKYYFQEQPMQNKITTPLLEMFSEILFNVGFRSTMYKYSDLKFPLYTYLFERDSPNELSRQLAKLCGLDLDGIPGGFHADDGRYLFTSILNKIKLDQEEEKISQQMIHIFTYFAKHGKPPKLSNSTWRPFDRKSPNFLAIDKNVHIVEEEPFSETAEFWANIYKNVS